MRLAWYKWDMAKIGDAMADARSFFRHQFEPRLAAKCQARLEYLILVAAVVFATIGISLNLTPFLLWPLRDVLGEELLVALPYNGVALVSYAVWFKWMRHAEKKRFFLVFGVAVLAVNMGYAQLVRYLLAVPQPSSTLIASYSLYQNFNAMGMFLLFPSYHLLPNIIVLCVIAGLRLWVWVGQDEVVRVVCFTVVPLLFAGVGKTVDLVTLITQTKRTFDMQRVFEEKEKALLSREMDLAHRIQTSLTPPQEMQWNGRSIVFFAKHSTAVGHTWAASHVSIGGDLTMVMVGAATTGIQAALVVHAVQALWAERLDSDGNDIERWVARVHHALLGLGRRVPHVVSLGILRLEGSRGTYWSAGHGPLFLVESGADGLASHALGGGGSDLGVNSQPDMHGIPFQLEPTTQLLLTAKGLLKTGTEAATLDVLNLCQTAMTHGQNPWQAMAHPEDLALFWVRKSA